MSIRAAGSDPVAKNLKISIAVSCVFAVVALVWGLVSRSQVMLLDALITPISLAGTWGALYVTRLVAGGPTKRYPFGRESLVPVFVIFQGVAMLATLVYAIFEALRIILAGGSAVAGGSLFAYGVFGTVLSLAAWLHLRRVAANRGIIEAEASGWFSAAASSAVIVLGAGFVLLTANGPLAWLAPFVDPGLVLLSSAMLIAVPFALIRKSIRDLQHAAPEPEIEARITQVIHEACRAEELPPPQIRLGTLGRLMDVEVGFVIRERCIQVDRLDRLRTRILDELQGAGYEPWLLVETTHKPEFLD
ncbi:cation diffusion facilitator transporter [Glutamicibacter uratoxydans]|uniref:Cation diffusion facilitator transporter n=1 Tax=Glutamicibacter uratoxydans TaxID=43667 RepID=A0A4Y4DQF7_GLUUR|nr:cation transporter [Glutamicibacter uratoxydans]GED06154.1 cation diffusion facilitator transporter [Glutamicibacter uratoxydans]